MKPSSTQLKVQLPLKKEHIRGGKEAQVTLIQYADFECPSCQDAYPIIRRIQNKVGNNLRLIFRHFPLSEQHPYAPLAAEAAEAAAAQGEKYFWMMHDLLFEHRDTLSPKKLVGYASEIGLDVTRFVKELKERKYKPLVEQNLSNGQLEGVQGTPTFFVNGKLYNGPITFDSLLEAVAKAGNFSDVLQSLDDESRTVRKAIDQSKVGAPASGKAVRDRFSSDEIFQRIMASADEEIDRDTRLLFFSGFAAGLIIGVSFLARSVMTAAYPEDPTILGNLLYPLGFIAIVLGGYQLFTENTLTPLTLVLTRLASIPSLIRLWGIVLLANISGTAVGALLFATTEILEPAAAEAAHSFGEHALSLPWFTLFFKAIIAGGMVATMVWMVHAARDTISRLFIIYISMILIPAAELFHCVVGAFEVFYLVFKGTASLFTVFTNFFLPVVLGNTIGGVVFVAFVNYGMTAERDIPHRDFRKKLSLKEWVIGRKS